MKLNTPKVITFWVGVLFGLLGFLGFLFKIPVLSTYAFWFEFIGFLVLVLGLTIKGL